jgi:hypothetical protein
MGQFAKWGAYLEKNRWVERMLSKSFLAKALMGVLAVISSRVYGANFLTMEIQISGTPSQTFYSAAPLTGFFANDTSPGDLQFQTGVISSADGKYLETTNGSNGWSITEPQFTSFSAFINSLEQSWSITLDKGLSTERDYTMSLNLGAFPSMNVTPPVITFPANQSVISPNTTTFTFTPPGLAVPFLLQLSHLPNNANFGSYVIDDQLDLAAGTTQWSAPSPLIANTSYYLDVDAFNIFPAGFAFSDPMTATGSSVPNWSSGANLSLESSEFFSTALPEPGSLSGLVFGVPMLLKRRRR